MRTTHWREHLDTASKAAIAAAAPTPISGSSGLVMSLVEVPTGDGRVRLYDQESQVCLGICASDTIAERTKQFFK